MHVATANHNEANMDNNAVPALTSRLRTRIAAWTSDPIESTPTRTTPTQLTLMQSSDRSLRVSRPVRSCSLL